MRRVSRNSDNVTDQRIGGAGLVDTGASRQDEHRTPTESYIVRLDLQFPYLNRSDAPALVDAATDPWFSERLCRVKGSVGRVGATYSEAHWHTHEFEDEFTYCIEGEFLIDFHDRTIKLQARQGFVIPKGVVHRTRAREIHPRCLGSAADGRQRLMILRASTE
jgi:mannose-6-phosphate isomerase-like protein (cupin superfamily)